MTGKTDGTSTWTYTWDDDNRLTRVQGPGGVDVAYEYDSMGRMLTRDDGTAVTSFTWDGWNCVREDDGTNVFRYYCPQGELHSFEVNDDFYHVHCDALGSVRAITDDSGAVVGSYTYGPWGETLSATEPTGFTMPFKWVGALGVRHDPATGLTYMRNRWYDPELGRFLSTDPLRLLYLLNVRPQGKTHLTSSFSLYVYARSNPAGYTDPTGLAITAPGVADFCDRVTGSPPGTFAARWNDAMNIARNWIMSNYVNGYPVFMGLWKRYLPAGGVMMPGYSPDDVCDCQLQADIEYERYFSTGPDRYDIEFRPLDLPGKDFNTPDHGQWVNVWQDGCNMFPAELASSIIHELTHVGLTRIYGPKYWLQPGYLQRGLLAPDPLPGQPDRGPDHPYLYFGTGADCRPTTP